MNSLLGHRLSPSMVVALVALVVALTGTAFASGLVNGDNLIKKNSLSANRLRNHTISGTQLNLSKLGMVPSSNNANHATTADTANHATSADIAANANHATGADIAASATKATTATSADNATTATSADSATTAATANALESVAYRVDTSAGPITVPACSANPCTPDKVGTSFAIATCPPGTVAIGGGGVTHDAGVELSGSFPTTAFGSSVPNAWEVDVDNFLQTISAVDYYVVCTATRSVDGPSGF